MRNNETFEKFLCIVLWRLSYFWFSHIFNYKTEVCGSLVFGATGGTASELSALHFWQYDANEITGNKQLKTKAIPEQINHHFSVFRT